MDASTVHGKHGDKEHAMTLEREWLTGLIGSMADGVLAIDDRTKVLLYNGAALSLLDKNSNITGKSLSRVLELYDKDNNPLNIHDFIENIKVPTTNRDYLLHYDDGSMANLYLSVAPVYFGYGTTEDRGYVLLIRDITREKSLEEERDEFISVVSHELRTPIAITEGNISNAQFIAEKSGDITEIKKALEAAHSQVLFLAGLVNDLSTLSRAERGVLQVTVDTINPHQLVEDLVTNYTDQAATKGLKLKADLDPRLETLHSSNLYIREILQNFITNSIKYTEKGSVTVSAHVIPGGVRFDVSDTGIGMSRSDLQKIFTKFFRSEDYRTRQNNGTGLGLYITKKLASIMHAEITVDSRLNHGSTFTLTVPNLSVQEGQRADTAIAG
jgi:signal transduction histidine kinase